MPVALPAGTKVYLALAPVDMRKGYDGLAASVQQILQRDPFSGQLFLFRGKRGDRLKALWWDGGGLCLFAKRLEKGRFVWPRVDRAHPGAAGDADRRSRLAAGDCLHGLTDADRSVIEASESVVFLLDARTRARYQQGMRLDLACLPNASALLQRVVCDLADVLERRDAELAETKARLADRDSEIEKLQLFLSALKRQRFGRSSEGGARGSG